VTNKSVAIRANDVSVYRDKVLALRKLNFEVDSGQIIGLLGPSGSGKTTLIRAIVGVQTVKQGSLEVLGYTAGNKNLRSLVGYVTQSPSVYEDISIKQNLHYFGTLVGAKKEQINVILKQVQLYEIRSRLASDLSGGQRARLSLAIALLGSPDLLVLDEPTVGLDPLLRRDLWKLFKTYTKSGLTLLVSSHVMDEADHCDRLLLLRDGELLAEGTRASILQSTHGAKTIEAAFIELVEKGKGDEI